MFYLKFFEHPSFGQVAHEIYPSKSKVYSSKISMNDMYYWCIFLMAVATDLTHVAIFNSVYYCLSPVLISDKKAMLKGIAKSQTHMIRCWNARTAFFKIFVVLQRCPLNFRAIGRLKEAWRKFTTGPLMCYWISPKTWPVFSKTQVW